MAGIMSLLQRLGFTSGSEDDMNSGARYESDVEEEEEDEDEEGEEDEAEGRRGFPFSFSFFGKGRNAESSDDEEDDEDEEDEEEEIVSSRQRPQSRSSRVIDYKKSKEKKNEAASETRREKHCEHIVVVRQLSDSRTIITHLHNGDSVILNLENIDPKDCGRVIDLLSGAAFALGGNIIKVSRLTYLLAPDSVQVIPPQNMQSANRYTL